MSKQPKKTDEQGLDGGEKIRRAQQADEEAAVVKRKECLISREDFLAKAPPALAMSDLPVVAVRKEFSTGSFGWSTNDKVTITVDGVPLKCQVGINITVVNSKPAK